MLNHAAEEVGITVGEIQTKDGYARFGQLRDLFSLAGGGTDGGNDLGTHNTSFPFRAF